MLSRPWLPLVLALGVAPAFFVDEAARLRAAEPAAAGAEAKSDLFTRRILPIARSQKASSCTECHFAGVDLKLYVLDDEVATFAALRAAGLVDVRQPRNSKLLQFIARKPEREDPLLARVRAEESAAFTAWIEAAVRNPALLAAQPPATPIGTDLPLEVVRHARRDHVLQSFVENIWVETERCVNCHSPERNQRQVKEHGARVSWLSPRDPAGTLAQCIEQGIIDVDAPEKSLLLTKPLGIVEHGGHIKFVPGSRTDQQFRRFLNDYAAVVNGKYRAVGELPKEAERVILATGQQLRVTDLPQKYGGRLMRVLIHRREADGWSKLPVATGDSGINPKNGQWQNLVFAFVDRHDPAAKGLTETRLLPGDRYLAKLYIDRENRAAADPSFELSENDLFAEIEFSGEWKPGYLPPKIISAKDKK